MENNTLFYIIRHGETDWNAKHMAQGQTDIPLNAKGEAQAKELAVELRHERFDLAFSSDLLRAKRTAEIIALEHNLEVITTELLRERKFGPLEGKTKEGFAAYDALLQTLTNEQRFTYKLTEDMESDEEISTRLITFIRETAITHPGKTVLVGTHAGIMRALLLKLGNLRYEDYHHSSITNGAYVILESDGVEFTVKETKGIGGPLPN